MRDRILQLEATARQLEPTPQRRRELTDAAVDYANRFLDGLDDAPVYIPGEPDPAFGSVLGESGTDMASLLDALAREVDSLGINPASGAHLGYIPGGGVYFSALGDYLADVTNRYSGIRFASPGAAQLERRLVDWMANLVGYGEGAGGDLTSGGSIGNLSAIVTAREARGIRLAEIPDSCIYFTAQVHHCVTKAIGIAGLNEARKRIVPMDSGYRLDIAALTEMVAADRAAGLRPFLIVASAGTTDTGAIDPLEQIADLASEHNIWLHVDAAYGGCFLLCDEGRRKLAGIERSDSVVIDPHKGFFLPYGSGAVIVRDERALAAAFSYQANYMQDAVAAEHDPSPAALSPELTRPFRGLRLWFALKLAGLAPFRAAVEEKLMLARYFHEQVAQMEGFEVGPPPALTVSTYRYRPKYGDANDFNRRLCEAIQRDGEIFISSTTIDGTYILRLAVLNFRTHLSHIDRLLELLQHHAQRLESAAR